MALSFGHVNDAIAYFDNGLLDTAGIGTTYVVRGDEIAIVETGTSLCAPTVLQGLAQLGVQPREVRHILLTHVHLDHAGGAGALMSSMPEAAVYLHSLTSAHLVEPARLLLSAERALGDMFARHGTIVPLAPERMRPAENLRLDLGRGLMLEAIPTPGHSSDHLAFYEHSTASLFSGDSAGIVLPNYQYLGPVTPPPAFDVEAQRATFQRLLSLPIVHLLFSHWGPAREPAEVILGRLQASFEHFDQLMRERVEHGQVDEDAIIAAMVPDHSVPAAGQWVIAGWIRMSVQGLQRYYQKREAG